MEKLRQLSAEYALKKYKDCSDEELDKMIMDRFMLSASLLYSDDEKHQIQYYEIMGEIDACSEILSERKKAKDREVAKIESWLKDKNQRKIYAFKKLEYSVSPNGQLVASILEENLNGLRADEIRAWYDELLALNDDEYQVLLDALVDEGVLEYLDEKYFLFRICDKSLNGIGGYTQLRILANGGDEIKNSVFYMPFVISLLEKRDLPYKIDDLLTSINKYDPSCSSRKIKLLIDVLKERKIVSSNSDGIFIRFLGE
ncbi:MAG: hypothetical protein MJ166_09235 [Clostridia bacterium]|nr:hypothetical protein [Clostridia bacterium]